MPELGMRMTGHIDVTGWTRRCCRAGALAAMVVLGLSACAEAPAPLTGAMHFYVEAQLALAADDFDNAVTALQALQNLVGEQEVEVAKAAAAGADIAAVRQAFKPLSEAFARQDDIPTGYGIAFCPMADDDRGARWIQKMGEIANPYFGSHMLRCGVFEDDGGATDDGAGENEG